ncbi:MAG: PilZ domain-containing protein [Acidobacteriota bacterium]|nr:PilZ domain-containing protein [Acidobacteriota bacterium]
MTKIDQRTHQRAQLPLKVRWLNTSAVYTTRHSDISLGGCYLDVNAPVQVGQRISFVIQLPSERGLSLHGEVVHQRQKLGFGIRFTDLHESSQQRLARLIESAGEGQAKDE